jgi:hypothetical protein
MLNPSFLLRTLTNSNCNHLHREQPRHVTVFTLPPKFLHVPLLQTFLQQHILTAVERLSVQLKSRAVTSYRMKVEIICGIRGSKGSDYEVATWYSLV